MNYLVTVGFMPHGMCYLWKPGLVGLHVLGNGIIALSYFSIPLTLIYILRQRRDIPFNGIFLLFAAFILFCGTGHSFDIWTLWHPNYWIGGWLRLATAIVSLATAIALVVRIPQILALPSPSQMAQINNKLQEKIEELQQQQRTIAQQEEFLRSIHDNVREAIFVVDVEDGEFRYLSFNSAAVSLTGIAEVAGKTPRDILPLEIAKGLEARYQKCCEAKTSISYEECLPFKGQDSWWITTLNPISNAEGQIYRLIGTSINISDRKKAEMELDRDKNFLEALLDNLSDGIVACDADGVLTLFNRATKKFHGLLEEPIAVANWAEYYSLYKPDSKTVMKKEEIPLFRALEGESVRGVEITIVPKEGQPRTLLANGDPIIDRDGNKSGAVVAMRDITERKQAQQAFKELNQELEARVQARTVELEQRNQELDRFAYVTSHDLKAPLRAIGNLSEWIEEDLHSKLDEDARQNLNLLRGRVKRMNGMIDGLLAYSRVGRVASMVELVDVAVMLADTIDLLGIPDGFKIKILGEMPKFRTNLVPFQQVFYNLLSNAIKHSDRDSGVVTVEAKEDGDFYEFAVSDNGRGIAPQYHERIFEIFQTLEARDTFESTGIGLSIVKKAVENQGGKVTVESAVGQGCTFRFTWKKSS